MKIAWTSLTFSDQGQGHGFEIFLNTNWQVLNVSFGTW